MFQFLEFAGPVKKGNRTTVGGFCVSTVLSRDEGWETAILGEHGATPVERYKSKKLALAGHALWVKKMKNPPETVDRLGWEDIGRETITIKPARHPLAAFGPDNQ